MTTPSSPPVCPGCNRSTEAQAGRRGDAMGLFDRGLPGGVPGGFPYAVTRAGCPWGGPLDSTRWIARSGPATPFRALSASEERS